jgi:hypothetical protein
VTEVLLFDQQSSREEPTLKSSGLKLKELPPELKKLVDRGVVELSGNPIKG